MKVESNIYKLYKRYLSEHFWKTLLIISLILIVNLLLIIEPLIIKRLVDDVLISRKKEMLINLIILAVVVKTSGVLLSLYQKKISVKLSAKVFKNFTVDFYEHILDLDLKFYNKTRLGEFLHRLGQDVYHIYQMLFVGLTEAIINITVILIVGIAALLFNYKLALISFVIFPLLIFVRKKYGKVVRHQSERMVKEWTDVVSYQQEVLSNIKLVKELNYEKRSVDRYLELQKIVSKRFSKLEFSIFSSSVFSEFITFISLIVILTSGSIFLFKDKITIGGLIAFYFLISKLYNPLKSLVQNSINIQRAKVGVDRIYEYLNIRPEIINPVDPLRLKKIKGQIEFDDVSFAYDFGQRPVLEKINLSIQPGEHIAIVAASGEGKTTVINLLMRFYGISKGTIKIDGVNIEKYNIQELRERIGMVSQDVILFHDTILNNFKISKNDASEKEVKKACQIAQIHKFIMSLPEKYDTNIGEKGVELSGGQKQRLAIARALLKKPEIIIFDEATSHLDSENERNIHKEIKAILKGRTVIFIAHRLSTIKDCHKIYVLKNKKIAESGNHRDLLQKKGVYYRQWKKQHRRIVT